MTNTHDSRFNLRTMKLRDTLFDNRVMLLVYAHSIFSAIELYESDTNCVSLFRSIAPSIEM